MGDFQEYPKYKYHFNGESRLLKNAEEEARLGGGWANSPAAFERYKGPRRDGPGQYDALKWVDAWPVADLSEDHRKRIKIQLLKAHAAFWKSPDALNAEAEAMRRAFNGIAQTLFDAGLLSEQLLREDIPLLVWDSAIAGGWWRLASENRRDMFPEQLGHYWIWSGEGRGHKMLLSAESADWLARLLEATVAPDPSDLREPPIEINVPASPQPAPGGTPPESATDTKPTAGEAPKHKSQRPTRLLSSITSAVAARRLEEFLQRNNIGQTEFAGRVGTTDRTLRTFRQTGRVRRSIFDAIAREMGTTRESLLKP